MDDATNLETEVAPDDENIIEEQPEAAEVEDSDEETPLEEQQADSEDEDYEEVEIDGKRYKLTGELKDLKDGILRHADYTRKTQEVAAIRQRLEPLVQQAEAISEAEHQVGEQLADVNFRIRQLQETDWSQYDELTVMNARIEHQGLVQQAQQLQGALGDARQQRLSLAEQETALRFEEGRKVLQQTIPGWNTEKAQAVGRFAQEAYNIPPEFWGTREATDPVYVQVLHDAMLWRQSQKKAATTKKVEAQQAIQPAATVKGKGGNLPRGLSDDLSTAEWIKRRNAQVRKRNQ